MLRGGEKSNYDTEIFLKPGFQAVCYMGTMPRLVQIETWFFGIILCSLNIIQYDHLKRIKSKLYKNDEL